jgi:hypothetical protein
MKGALRTLEYEASGSFDLSGGELHMAASVGDRVVIESEKVGQPGRSGVVEEVLRENPSRLRVRWDDGRTSIIAPSAGAARFTRARRRATR